MRPPLAAMLLQLAAVFIPGISALALQRTKVQNSLEEIARSSFVSIDGLYCAEGPSRVAEGGLALKKAGPKGALFNTSFAQSLSCLARGYEIAGGEDTCYVGLQTSFKSSGDKLAFAAAEERALGAWANLYSLDLGQASLMATCTCHPDSSAQVGQDCSSLAAVEASWVHMNPWDNSMLMCDEGPFVHATYALSVLKSTAQLPMHEHDQIRATTCAALGFDVMYPPKDHCFTEMHIWTRDAMDVDKGVKGAQEVEGALFGGVFVSWAEQRELNVDILSSRPGCHCLPESSVGQSLGHACDAPSSRPPIRDWWVM